MKKKIAVLLFVSLILATTGIPSFGTVPEDPDVKGSSAVVQTIVPQRNDNPICQCCMQEPSSDVVDTQNAIVSRNGNPICECYCGENGIEE